MTTAVSAAPGYRVLRVATASTHAVFWSILAAGAVGLVAPENRGRTADVPCAAGSLRPR